MESNDLRIGNYIADYECEPYYFKVEEIKKRNFDLGVVYRNGSCWCREPELIELTEEILLKCGFDKLCDKRKGFKKSLYSNKYLSFDFDDGVLSIDWRPLLKIKYLHQLQNLYFALTNQELTINL